MNERKKMGIRPFWIFLGIFLGLPLVLCGGIAVWWVGRNSAAQAELDQRKTEIQGRGYPIDNATLSDFHAQNADNQYTGRWLSVIAAFDTQSYRNAVSDLPIVGLGEMPTPDQPWPKQPAIEKLLADYQQTLDEVHEISKSDRPTLFPIEFNSFNTLLEPAQAMRNISRLLQLEHEVALRTNDSNREFQSINSMLGTSVVVRGDPIMVSQLVSIALHGIAMGAIQSSVERGSMDDAQLAAIEQRLKIFADFNTPMRNSIAVERAFVLPILEEPGSIEEIAPPGPVNLLRALGPRPIDALFFLELSPSRFYGRVGLSGPGRVSNGFSNGRALSARKTRDSPRGRVTITLRRIAFAYSA